MATLDFWLLQMFPEDHGDVRAEISSNQWRFITGPALAAPPSEDSHPPQNVQQGHPSKRLELWGPETMLPAAASGVTPASLIACSSSLAITWKRKQSGAKIWLSFSLEDLCAL